MFCLLSVQFSILLLGACNQLINSFSIHGLMLYYSKVVLKMYERFINLLLKQCDLFRSFFKVVAFISSYLIMF